MAKEIIIIAGPNGSGKTTFARSYFKTYLDVYSFINADLISAGLSPFDPEKEAIQAGKLMLRQIEKLVQSGESFLLETTLATKTYALKIPQWQKEGYKVSLIFLSLSSPEIAIIRVQNRVREGGHDIPEEVIRRRFKRGLENFQNVYKKLVDYYYFYDNSSIEPILISGSKYNG